MSYRWLFSSPRGEHSAEQLLDTLVELLVRLHLAGVFWGDCSLSNTLFRLDAGALTAYLVDAETVERHPTLSDGQRAYDVDLAPSRSARSCSTCRSAACCPRTSTRSRPPRALPARYEALWDEVTHEEVFDAAASSVPDGRAAAAAQRPRLRRRRGRADHVEPEGARLRVHTRVAEPGQHRRELFRLTGLEVQERQARRLLNDMLALTAASLEQKSRAPVLGELRGAPLARRGLPAGGRRDPAATCAGRLAPGRGLPRGAGAPLVPVRAGEAGRRDGGGGASRTSRTCCPGRPRRSPRRR